ncbi:MAG TPA: hypothetical protein VIK55_08305 [Paludibacter sp.]
MGTSKMDSSAVYTLFEELKQKIDELGKRATPINQANSTSDPKELISLIEDLQIQINQQQFTPEQIRVLQANLGQISAYLLGKVNDSLRTVITELKVLITPIDEKINLLKSQQNMVIRKEHVFSVDFRNSKAAITIITMALFILLSLGGNIWQFNRISQLKDNGLKYRYIKMQGEASQKNLLRLETIFTYDRNKDSISVIRKQVENFERLVKEQAEKIERARLNATERNGHGKWEKR